LRRWAQLTQLAGGRTLTRLSPQRSAPSGSPAPLRRLAGGRTQANWVDPTRTVLLRRVRTRWCCPARSEQMAGTRLTVRCDMDRLRLRQSKQRSQLGASSVP
jgi:hypothetical protein